MIKDILDKLAGMPKEIKGSGHMGPKEAVEQLNQLRPEIMAIHRHLEVVGASAKDLERVDMLERDFFRAACALHDWAKDHFAKMPDLSEKPEKKKKR